MSMNRCITLVNHIHKPIKYEESLFHEFCSKSGRVGTINGYKASQFFNGQNGIKHSTKRENFRSFSCPKRHIHMTGSNNQKAEEPDRQLPRLLYVQNPIIWFSNKMDFRYLRRHWDPQFTEAEFSRGARQAVSKITELISKNMFDSLRNLLTRNALMSLRKDIEVLWADEVRRNIGLRPEDVQLVIPRKLYFRDITSQRFCDIDMVFIGLKWLEQFSIKNPPLLFVDIFGRFHRNYTAGIHPEWTVSAFRVRRFNVMPPKNRS